MSNNVIQRIGYTATVAVILIGGAIPAYSYFFVGATRHQPSVFAGPAFNGINTLPSDTAKPSLLPARFQNGAATLISPEHNASVLQCVFVVFDPALLPFLKSVPIVLDPSADTAKAYLEKGYIGVSPDWDNNVLQSRFRTLYEQRGMKLDDPVFISRFKADLLIHEFLHLIQAQLRIDGPLFYNSVARWYIDPRYGIPSPGGMVYADTPDNGKPDTLATNRMKYILWHALYNYRRLNDLPQDESWKNMQYGERYRQSDKGVEEFAYIGQEILASGSSSEHYIKTGQWSDKVWKDKKMRLMEVSPGVVAAYRGVFNPLLMR